MKLSFIRALTAFALTVTAGFCASATRQMPGDAGRGTAVFHDQHCVTCHAIRGQGGDVGPDLGWIIGREYTPASMASLMWNHAPEMWSAIERRGVAQPTLSEADAADLFAYFHSIRAFEKPGDAARGKALFSSKHCNRCHGTVMALAGGAPPVSEWHSLVDAIELAQAMWNHAGRMQARMAEVQVRWPELTSQDLADLLTYLQNLPHIRKRAGQFSLNGADGGAKLLLTKGCVDCHRGRLALETRLGPGTMSDFAVSMWNHSPKMWAYGRKTGRKPPALEKDEMRQIVRYLWYTTLFAEPGNPARGRRVFIGKNCAQCHETGNAGAPNLAHALGARSDPLRPFSIVAVLWQHGPKMLAAMRKRRLPWPNFTRGEMADLLAYLNAYMVNSE